MKVFGNKIVVKEEKVEKIGDLIVPESNRQEPKIGLIVEIGEEVDSSLLNQGDRVMYPHFAGVKFEIKTTEYTLLKVEEIIVKL